MRCRAIESIIVPEKKSNNIYEELSLRKSILETIESYLFLVIENTEECDRNAVAENVCKNTLAYSLANDQEKKMLESIFEAVDCPFLLLDPSKRLSRIIPSGESGMFSIQDNTLTPLSFKVFL